MSTDDDLEAKAWLAGVFDRAAPSYDGVAGGYHDHFGARLVDLTGIEPGDRVLDVACGRGAVLLPAAARVGATGRAVGVDLSPEMVRLAGERADLAGADPARSDVELHVMDAEHLDFPNGSFSAVLSGFGIFFLPHPELAMAEFHRVLAPGGVVGVSTWGAEDERWAWEDELLADVEVERRAVRRPFDQHADLGTLLHSSGFADATVRTEHHEVRLADADEWWAWKWSYSLRGVLEQLTDARLDRLRREASEHIAQVSGPGGLALRLEALIAIGHR
jgi:ubiquinone/menaquinone biosynthesis C-methylase UbiE